MYRYPRIRDIREDNEITQKEIADKLKTTQRQYSRWETGASEIPTHIVIKLSDYYGVTTDYLLGIPDRKKRLKQGRGETK